MTPAEKRGQAAARCIEEPGRAPTNPVGARGFTLAELLIGLLIFGFVASAVTQFLLGQQRIAERLRDTSRQRDQLREGVETLAAELRALSAAGGDILPGGIGTSSLEFFSTKGSSVACALSGASTFRLPPLATADTANRVTFLLRRPEPGNGVFVFDEGPSPELSDDRWIFRSITGVADIASPCPGTGFAALGGAPGLSITVNLPLPNTVLPGAPVRFVERVRYALYQSADRRWYLGSCISAAIGATCSGLQPISGPYRAANSNPDSGESGLDLFYLDSLGARTVVPAEVAKVVIVLRAPARRAIGGAGVLRAGESPGDTLIATVALRNR